MLNLAADKDVCIDTEFIIIGLFYDLVNCFVFAYFLPFFSILLCSQLKLCNCTKNILILGSFSLSHLK